MAVNTQVSGNKIFNIQPSKNLGTAPKTQLSGKAVEATHEYRKLTNVKPTQVSGGRHFTNYMGINDEGMNIFTTKKINGDVLGIEKHPTAYEMKNWIIENANSAIKTQEADKKLKHKPVITPVAPAPDENSGENQNTENAGTETNADEDLPET